MVAISPSVDFEPAAFPPPRARARGTLTCVHCGGLIRLLPAGTIYCCESSELQVARAIFQELSAWVDMELQHALMTCDVRALSYMRSRIVAARGVR